MFGRTKDPNDHIVVVEVEKPSPVPSLTAESKGAILSLKGHPGISYLLARLHLQCSYLETALRNNRHNDLCEVSALQAGIFWSSWLQRQLEEPAGAPK